MPEHQAKASQGNIEKSFARKNLVYLFFRLDDDPDKVRPLLGALVNDVVTSADKQAEITKAWKDALDQRKNGNPVKWVDPGAGMFGLSWTGFERLGLDGSRPEWHSQEDRRVFMGGMKTAGSYLFPWDPERSLWEGGYREFDVDGFILLANDSPAQLAVRMRKAKRSLSKFAEILAEENGYRLQPLDRRRNPDNLDMEHFGFADGVSNPPGDLSALLPSGGSYAAFLKLEQNVLAFRRISAEIADAAQQPGITPEVVQRRAVGRAQDGAPLVPRGADNNAFDFRDAREEPCPYHAHIRVMNGRDGSAPVTIVRRGSSYGPARGDLIAASRQLPPSTGVGLLFLSFQQNLLHFLYLMHRAQFFQDALLSRSANWQAGSPNSCDGAQGPGQRWKLNGATVCQPMADITTPRGGEFFYIPGMEFIRNLGQ